MRLLDTSTLTLHEFFGDAIPNYAILSHRWEGEEVTFQDLQAGRAPGMKGFPKIKGCCAQAVADGFLYAWVDSCCIDKTSSAELSEAINSMFHWYKRSQVCYVYLSDVSTGLNWDSHQRQDSELRLSKWWTRGWTLQELIGPLVVIFYDRAWMELGTKKWMEILISSITGISCQHLRDYTNASVAQKMSWASKRETTRVEDRAYSLMGLFSVHMPPLYGEGMMAFRRLQLEILARSEDESLFAWTENLWRPSGLLAHSPSEFAGSGDIVRRDYDPNRPPFAMTNKGLRMESFLVPTGYGFWAPLNCARKHGQVALFVWQPPDIVWAGEEHHANENTFNREGYLGSIDRHPPKTFIRTVLLVRQEKAWSSSLNLTPSGPLNFSMRTNSLLQQGFTDFQEGFNECCQYQLTTRDVAEYGEGQEKRRIVLDSGDFVCLKFRSRPYNPLSTLPPRDERDSFVIVLSTDIRDTVSVDILITHENQLLEEDVKKLLHNTWEWQGRLDRISKTMKSGRSVSAALRSKARLGEPCYVLDITFDPEGKLTWPDPDLS
jgi:hypothetical protein